MLERVGDLGRTRLRDTGPLLPGRPGALLLLVGLNYWVGRSVTGATQPGARFTLTHHPRMPDPRPIATVPLLGRVRRRGGASREWPRSTAIAVSALTAAALLTNLIWIARDQQAPPWDQAHYLHISFEWRRAVDTGSIGEIVSSFFTPMVRTRRSTRW